MPARRLRIEKVDARAADLDAVVRKLRGTMKARAYVVSTMAEIDNRELPLGDALRSAMIRQRGDVAVESTAPGGTAIRSSVSAAAESDSDCTPSASSNAPAIDSSTGAGKTCNARR